jgi:hypothetical protein
MKITRAVRHAKMRIAALTAVNQALLGFLHAHA